MKLTITTGILAVGLMTGGLWAQTPNVTNNGQNSAKPAAGAPAPAVKPAAIPGAKPAAVKPAAASVSSQNNTLERVNVVRKGDDVQIEIQPREAVTPKVSKLSAPARVVVELAATAMATPQSKIAVGSAGVKGVRIGMDGKTPPTTSVVVDLEQACGYELKPGSGNSFVLTLHAQAGAVAKSAPVPAPAKAVTAKAAAPAPAPTPTPKLQTAAAKPVPAAPAAVPAEKKNAAPVAAAAKPHDAPAPKKPATGVAVAVTTKPAAKPAAPAATKIAANEKPAAASKPAEAPKPPKPEEKKWAMSGKRDPFFSPVVQQPTGSGCSTGKKCLEIGQINVRGVVKSDSGYIAVVTNSLNKAYFLRENDPVFNGYVMRITGDTVVFQETVQDKLGKPMTHEVVKRIFTPAV